MTEFGRGNDGRVGDLHTVVNFVFFLQAAQDSDSGLHRWLTDQNFLKASLQRGVFFNVLAVLVERRGTHTMQLAARQCRLEHIARVHGTLSLAGADHGVQLVNEDNGLALVLGQFLEHGFQTFLELTAEFGTCQQGGHVEREHPLALE